MRHRHSKPSTLASKQKQNGSLKPKLVKETPVKSVFFEDEGSPSHVDNDVDEYEGGDAVNELHTPQALSSQPEPPPTFAHLPQEVLQQIFTYVAHTSSSQTTLCASCLVSRSWYQASVVFLYDSPRISGRNYDLFVRTVCPSINAHIRTNGLADLVRTLDMSGLVHDGSKSLTARLLGRVKGNVEAFVAPQASFAVNCLAALSRCHKLIRLDLSLVSESLAMTDLVHSISSLRNLESFHFPRSSYNGLRNDALFDSWPPKLRKLQIAGGIRDESILYFSTIPSTLTHLDIGDCPHLSMAFIKPLFTVLGPHLQHLRIDSKLPKLSWYSLDCILDDLRSLRHLNVAADYICEHFFGSERRYDPNHPYLLESLQLSCRDSSVLTENHNVIGDVVWNAVVDGPFRNLRRLRLCQKLGWTRDEEGRRSVKELSALLEALAREDRDRNALDEGVEAGVWVFE